MNEHNLAAPPAIVAAAPAAQWDITEYAAYQTQEDAHAGSVMDNLREAAKVIREIANFPKLLGNTQVMEELDRRLEYLDRQGEGIALRAAMALLGERPEAKQDPEMLENLAFIQRYVAPRRNAGCLKPVEMPAGSAMDNLAAVMALDEGGDGAAQLPAWVVTLGDPDA